MEPFVLLPLTQGYFAKIDRADLPRVLRHSWSVNHRPTGDIYAQTTFRLGQRTNTISLHRFIMQPPPGVLVDHRDGDGLNCTRENMRLATVANNTRNRRKHRGASSRYKGVYYHRRSGLWQAQAWHDRRPKYLGMFASEIDAAICYDIYTVVQADPFSRLNFPIENYLPLLRYESPAADSSQSVAEGVGTAGEV